MVTLTKRTWLFLVLVVPLSLTAQTRRAVLIGIDNYNPDDGERARLQREPIATAVPRAKTEGDATYWRFDNLDGAINDISLIKSTLSDLGVTDFVILQNQEATAQAILTALKKNLVDDAKAGDIRIVYYSGHGNHVRNVASAEQNGEDQTIVPADNWRNVPDVRDKEISRILWQAARKGVKVTFIADSCHSGSLSRGAWNASGKARSSSGKRGGNGANALKEPSVNDPAEIDPKTKKAIDPEKEGVLTLAAAQSSEEAREIDTEEGPHGAFTWALAHALKYEGEPMNRVLQRVAVQMHSSNVAQQPVMGGAGRAGEDLFGQPANEQAGLRLLVEAVDGKTVKLRGGRELGLYPDCVLKGEKNPAVELKVTAANALGSSTAQVTGQGAVKVGDLFTVDKWVTPAKANLKIYVPAAAPTDVVRKTAAEMGKLRSDASIEWVTDPTAGQPVNILSWNGSAWILESNPAQGKPADLGAAPTADAVKKLLGPHATFLFIAPPTQELTAALHPAASVESVKQRPDAQYWLCGRIGAEGVEYAWVLPDQTEATAHEMGNRLPLPLRTDWIPESANAAAALDAKARVLARIRGWLTLESPPSQGAFPYHLALKNADTGTFHATGDVKDGDNYKLYLKADEAALKDPASLARRWVYAFAIDSFGECTLLYPDPARGNEGNLQPYTMNGAKPKFDAEIALPGAEFSIAAPFGVDSYFLLTTQEAIDPNVFTAEGVRTRGGARGGAAPDALTEMLSDVNTGTRAAKRAEMPGTWSLELQTIRSVAK
ncbi:MAG TPA: caspase family protein [Bryobacteraceae bacterium]|nr:caspase family protein [Bryobacteraceae bacterium]